MDWTEVDGEAQKREPITHLVIDIDSWSYSVDNRTTDISS